MDMDMDIPDLEELELLESHTLDDQFDDDFELDLDVEPPSSPPSSPPPDAPPKRPIPSLPPKPSPFKPHPQINPSSNKNAASNLPKSISLDATINYDLEKNGSNRKRSRTGEDEAQIEKCARPESPDAGPEDLLNGNVESVRNDDEGSDDDEEWLRYSPPQRESVEEMEVVEGETEEKILSRYATEIDGDCVPVTGLDGERVYAKLCGVELDEERNKRLRFRGDFNGEAITSDVLACLNCHNCNLFLLE